MISQGIRRSGIGYDSDLFGRVFVATRHRRRRSRMNGERLTKLAEAFADISEQQLSEAGSAALVPVSESCGAKRNLVALSRGKVGSRPRDNRCPNRW